MELPPPAVDLRRLAVGRVGDEWGERSVPEEVAISLTYNRDSHAVMMATPLDLEDFGVGFSLNEGLIGGLAELTEIEVCRHELGLELRMTLGGEATLRSLERRRRLAGPVGCGLCGIESLAEALRPLPRVLGSVVVSRAEVRDMVGALAAAQVLNRRTRAVHAAAFWRADAGLFMVREDVGRHNALDKLAGALARAGESAASGVLVISSRVSVEMVQKAAMMGACILVAVSAPTALAVRTAEAAGVTLIAVARDDGFEVFSAPQRVGR
ncbi:MAG: formate dehydrogenase accessory sulfurtransferase FdhD [Gammaproteobacteria bacterium]|nr:formate dehydrogenase accessory sulfurtransferase FdhD [Gammaproteobacteria bacterium]